MKRTVLKKETQKVLIVAKCNVNRQNAIDELSKVLVLIVAKCNVNFLYAELEREIEEGINSSKV